MLLFAGDLERARRQIEAIDVQRSGPRRRRRPSTASCWTPSRPAATSSPRGLEPGFFGEPPEHLRLRLEAVNRLREGRPTEAAETLARANEATPDVHGQLNGQAFQSLRDADDLFAGVLEVMAHGRYFWVGLEQVRLLTMNPPRFPRDLLFIPAHLELEDEQGDVFLPALYPGSHEHADDQVRLGRVHRLEGARWRRDAGDRPAYLLCAMTRRSACSNGGNGGRTQE